MASVVILAELVFEILCGKTDGQTAMKTRRRDRRYIMLHISQTVTD